MSGEDASQDELPKPIRNHLYALVDRLLDADGLLVLLDFDGSLAAIEERPEDATLPDDTRREIRDLRATPGVEVAVVSGRELADVHARVGVDGISYAGNHGLEMHRDGETVVQSAAEEATGTLKAVCDDLDRRLADVDGAFVEEKGVTASVHHRLASDERVPDVKRLVREAVAAHGGGSVEVSEGKGVLELRPTVEWDKGHAVEWLCDRHVPDGEEWLPIYVGDDTTDEDAFRALGEAGVGVKVGRDAATEASYRVADPDATRSVLSWLSEYGVEFLATSDGARPTAEIR